MTTSLDNIQALKELAQEYGLEITIAPNDARKANRPTHTNAGKVYRTKSRILSDLNSAKAELRKAKEDRSQALALAREGRRVSKEAQERSLVLIKKVEELTKEAIDRKIRIGKKIREVTP